MIWTHFFQESHPADRPSGKPITARPVVEAVLRILNSGADWHRLPQSYPKDKTAHRRFRQLCQNEVTGTALAYLANTLRETGAIDDS